MDAFRRGAAECVLVGDDYIELLQVVALEQMRIWREERDRRRSERRDQRAPAVQREHHPEHEQRAARRGHLGYRHIWQPHRRADSLSRTRGARRPRDLGLVRTGSRDRALIARTLEEGVRFKGAETVVTRADRTVVPIGISCAPMVDDEGQRIGAVAIFQDLTEIKQLQQQVLQTEKMASIGQLAAGVAHEINNPMGFIHANLFQMSEYVWSICGECVSRP